MRERVDGKREKVYPTMFYQEGLSNQCKREIKWNIISLDVEFSLKTHLRTCLSEDHKVTI